MSKVRMKVTITGYYEADPAHYGDEGNSPARMAKLDQGSFNEGPSFALAAMDEDMTITVEPV
jgi:hypothetical protein